MQISIAATKTKGWCVLRSAASPYSPPSGALGILGLELCVALHFDCRGRPEIEHGLLIFRSTKKSSSDFWFHVGEGYTYMTQCRYICESSYLGQCRNISFENRDYESVSGCRCNFPMRDRFPALKALVFAFWTKVAYSGLTSLSNLSSVEKFNPTNH